MPDIDKIKVNSVTYDIKDNNAQRTLVSGTNIKTINNQSILGSGNITMSVAVLDAYPVGSIYMSVNSTNPSSIFGGTWVQLKDKFLLGAGDTYNAGTTGGEAEHTLTINEMPSHTHSYNTYSYTTHEGSASTGVLAGATSGTTGSTGGGQAHNNMPPYLTVYMFKRTA